MKQLIVLVADVKYPSSNNIYLTAGSFFVEKDSVEDFEKTVQDFKEVIEQDGFKVVNFLCHIPPVCGGEWSGWQPALHPRETMLLTESMEYD